MRRFLITGGAGFIGHHIAEHILKNTEDEVVLFDKLSYVSPGWSRVRDIKVAGEALVSGRLKLVSGDFTKGIEPGVARELGKITHILHLGAMSHVDMSIKDPLGAIHDNVIGTHHIIEFARSLPSLELMLYFSTDEVYGPAPKYLSDAHVGPYETDSSLFAGFVEGHRFNPSNPYAATKAAAELLCMSAANTWKLPIVITNTMNVFGERQHPEKLIPKVIRKLRAGELIQIHGDAEGNSGSRNWIHARNVADAILFICNLPERLTTSDPRKGRFNIVGEREITTLDLVRLIADTMGVDMKHEVVNAAAERPGHDFRYALDGSKLAALGWRHPMPLEQALAKTLEWMRAPENADWLNH